MDRLTEGTDCRFDSVRVGSRVAGPEDIIQILSPHLSGERRAGIERVVSGRTHGIVPVVEGSLNTGNVSAIMRTSEALGLQDFHIISSNAPLKQSKRTTQGAHKWLDVFSWSSSRSCTDALRKAGYRIVVTHVDEGARPIDQIDFWKDAALVFGNELHGATAEMLACADETCYIPMPGFVESFNISVAAAIALHTARRQRLPGGAGDLSLDERMRLTADFYLRSVRSGKDIVERALRSGADV